MKKAKIMLIEDQLIPAHDLRRQLTDMGYEVVAMFTEAEKALEFLGKNRESEAKPDVVILDISLAGKMDGLEASKIINADYDCEVIFLTGLLEKKVLDEILQTQPSFFLIKPFDIYYTHICIQVALRQRLLHREIKHLRSEVDRLSARS
jgi:CheY-like chemotaxis protein